MADASIPALLQEALTLHRQGALDQAAARYVGILRADPANTDAHYHLARARCEQGQIAEGIYLLRKGLAIDPGQVRAHKFLGMALFRSGKHEEALTSFDRAIALQPAGDAYGGRADALVALGRLEEAVESFDRCLALTPDSVADWCNRGAALHDLGRYQDALASYDRVIAQQPDFAEAHYNRGNALDRLGRHDEAVASYDRALALNPHYADALNNRGNALDKLGRHPEALASLERALAIDGGHHGALVTRAIVLRKLGRFPEALASCEAALAARPGEVEATIVRSDVLIDLERFEEAIEAIDFVVARKPDAAESKWNKSLLCLNLGRLKEGFELYDHRWAGAKDLVPRDYRQPRWDGGRVDGTLLVWGEQGLGDEILHSSMMPDVLARTDTVMLEAEPRLVPLFARSFPALKLISLTPELYGGRVDAQIALGSLGKLFRPGWDAFPRRDNGYLAVDEVRANELRARLSGDRKSVIGISWISRAPAVGKSKSARLIDFEPLLRLPGCRFIDLQYGDTLTEREAILGQLGIAVERLPDIDTTNDIDGLAALMAACDAVVTVSNTTAHIAGATGRPTWVMVPCGHARIWYWSKVRTDCAWYPHVQVRRQLLAQPWSELVAAVASEVAAFVDTGRSRP